jgi:hypothetical protein
MVDFTAVKNDAGSSYEFSDEFINDFEKAWNYLQENPSEHLRATFPSAAERDQWFNKMKTYGAYWFREKVVVRRVRNTGSLEKDHGMIHFTMEPESLVRKRHERLRAEAKDRQARRERGEIIKRGQRRQQAA